MRSRKAGRDALDKQDAGDELDARESSALAFYHALNKAFEAGTYRLNRQALMDPEVAIGKEPDELDARGKVVKKGKVHYADPKGGGTAYAMLVHRRSFAEQAALMNDEEETASNAPTREELIADLRTLMQTDPDLIAEAGLQPK